MSAPTVLDAWRTSHDALPDPRAFAALLRLARATPYDPGEPDDSPEGQH